MYLYGSSILGVPYGATGQFEIFVYFMAYFIMFWMPFVCLGSSPKISMKMKKIIRTEKLTITIVPQ
jgi:hypothetical protein